LIASVKKASPHYHLNELCTLFELSTSTYYYQNKPTTTNTEEQNMIINIKAIAQETGNSYGKRRMMIELHNRGFELGVHKTASLMKKANVVAIRPKKPHYYPNTGEVHNKADNLLKRQFNPEEINTHWVGDITYIWTHQGWSYLACVLDLGSREIVGWALSQHPNAALAKQALTNAIQKHQPVLNGLQFHSDQGVQYSANLFVDYLTTLTITQSMSRRGNCWDNAVMERFFRSLKTERLNQLSFINHTSVVQTVERYIRFYNYKRLHSSIGYMTPNQKAMELKKVA